MCASVSLRLSSSTQNGIEPTKAPLGLYRLRYASGNRWQGETELFGPDTVYSEAEKTFEFRRTGDQAEGYSVRLIFQTDGNLATKLLSATQF